MNFVQLSVEMVSKITLCSQSKVAVKVILLMFCSCLDDHPPNSIVFMLRFEIRTGQQAHLTRPTKAAHDSA